MPGVEKEPVKEPLGGRYMAMKSHPPKSPPPASRPRALGLVPTLVLAGLALLAFSVGSPLRAEGLRVVASIAPLHSLVAAVMAGAGTPELLVPAERSPHGYSLKPSDAQSLAQAQLIVWIGPGLDAFVGRAARALAPAAVTLEVIELPGLTLYPPSAGHNHDEDADGGSPVSARDPHIWLDPTNAGIIAAALADVLARLDPAHAALYAANRAELEARLDRLDRELRARLVPFHDVRFVTFHSGYQYLERRYGLEGGEALTIDPEQQPGARRVAEIRKEIEIEGVRCAFTEPQFPAALVATLIEGTAARTAAVDPEGFGLTPGPDQYFELLERLGEIFAACLGD